MFADLWLNYHERHIGAGGKNYQIMWFVDNHVSTEALDQKQMAEYLTNFKNHYGHDIGVNLTDPDARGWGNLLEEK